MKKQTLKVKRCFSGFPRGLFTKSPLGRGLGRSPMNTAQALSERPHGHILRAYRAESADRKSWRRSGGAMPALKKGVVEAGVTFCARGLVKERHKKPPAAERIGELLSKADFTPMWHPVGESNPCFRRERATS